MHEVSDLSLGKPPLRSISITDTVADALNAIKRSGESYISVWNCHHSINKKPHQTLIKENFEFHCKCIGKVCMVDIICFLCKPENLSSPAAALRSPVSILLSDDSSSLVRHIQPNARFGLFLFLLQNFYWSIFFYVVLFLQNWIIITRGIIIEFVFDFQFCIFAVKTVFKESFDSNNINIIIVAKRN